MGLFRRKQKNLPEIDTNRYEPVLRCSICSGEQVLCLKDRETGSMHELMLIRDYSDLAEVCSASGIDPDSVRKVY